MKSSCVTLCCHLTKGSIYPHIRNTVLLLFKPPDIVPLCSPWCSLESRNQHLKLRNFVKMDFHKEDTERASKLSSEPLLSPDEFYYDTPPEPKRVRSRLLWITHAIYLAAITGIFTFFLFAPSSPSAIDCARQENAWCQWNGCPTLSSC